MGQWLSTTRKMNNHYQSPGHAFSGYDWNVPYFDALVIQGFPIGDGAYAYIPPILVEDTASAGSVVYTDALTEHAVYGTPYVSPVDMSGFSGHYYTFNFGNIAYRDYIGVTAAKEVLIGGQPMPVTSAALDHTADTSHFTQRTLLYNGESPTTRGEATTVYYDELQNAAIPRESVKTVIEYIIAESNIDQLPAIFSGYTYGGTVSDISDTGDSTALRWGAEEHIASIIGARALPKMPSQYALYIGAYPYTSLLSGIGGGQKLDVSSGAYATSGYPDISVGESFNAVSGGAVFREDGEIYTPQLGCIYTGCYGTSQAPRAYTYIPDGYTTPNDRQGMAYPPTMLFNGHYAPEYTATYSGKAVGMPKPITTDATRLIIGSDTVAYASDADRYGSFTRARAGDSTEDIYVYKIRTLIGWRIVPGFQFWDVQT